MPRIEKLGKFFVGQEVRLKKKVKVYKGDEDFPTARIVSFLSDIPGGVFLDNYLRGYRYWNVDDLKPVKKSKKDKKGK